jgi:hypothetical protein
MSATSEQIQAVEDQFFAAVPEALAFRTDQNLDVLYNFILGAFPESVLSVASWEIAFKSCKLKRIPGYVEPVTDEQRAMVNDTPGYLARERYNKEPEFRKAFDAVANEEKERKDLLDWHRVYTSMDPNEAAERLVHEPGFESAVQKLIDAGLI